MGSRMGKNELLDDEKPRWGVRSWLDWEREKTDELIVWLVGKSKLTKEEIADLEHRLSVLKQIRGT